MSIFEGFSISHAAILDGTTGIDHEFGDIYGVNEGSLESDGDSYDNVGDDQVLSTWFWENFTNISIQAGYVPFNLISLMTGAPVTSSTGVEGVSYSIPFGTKSSTNQPPRPVRIRVPSKDVSGAPRNFDFIFYRVQFEPISFEGPSYKDGLKINYSGRAVPSLVDEKGTPLSEPTMGRIINTPA